MDRLERRACKVGRVSTREENFNFFGIWEKEKFNLFGIRTLYFGFIRLTFLDLDVCN